MSSSVRSADQQALIAALRQVSLGNRDALQDVYRRTSAKLYGICLRICQDRSEAEDVLQDIFITIWHKAGSYDAAQASPITWLATLARNRSIDRIRSRATRKVAPIELADTIADDTPDAERRLLDDEASARIVKCIQALSSGDRRLIESSFFEGSTYAELAARATIPLSTIKSRIRRALLALRACLS